MKMNIYNINLHLNIIVKQTFQHSVITLNISFKEDSIYLQKNFYY